MPRGSYSKYFENDPIIEVHDGVPTNEWKEILVLSTCVSIHARCKLCRQYAKLGYHVWVRPATKGGKFQLWIKK